MIDWTFEVAQTDAAGFEDAAKASFAGFCARLDENGQELGDEALEQVAAAIKATKALVGAGVVGTGTFGATLSGRANPGHAPLKNVANDHLMIALHCADAAPEEVAE